MTHDEIKIEIERRLRILDEETLRQVLMGIANSIIHHIDDEGRIHEAVDCLNDILDDLENQGIDPVTVACDAGRLDPSPETS